MAETIRTPVFRRYEVVEKIGSGGMGAVYKARDARLDRWVALKVLPPGLREDAESLERFRREARLLAQLKHPGVASVFDADVEGDFPYLAMEFVAGDNLEQVLAARGPMTVEEVIRLGIEIAEALEHIHCHRIVHRDIKTANIIIGPEGRAVLTDFGIAHAASLPRLSLGAIGTPEYMSPEQADGRQIDGRSDLYSVGVVLYECLTGTPPFARVGTDFAGLAALLHQIIEVAPTPLTERRPDVPAWLAEVVMRCLAKDAADRFTRAAALAAALQKPPLPSPVGKGIDAPEDAPVPEGERRIEQAALLVSHSEPVEAVRFSPNGKLLASTCRDRAVRIWEAQSGRLLHQLKSPSAVSLAFSPGGGRLATGCVDGRVRIWDVRAERRIRIFDGHTGYVLSVAFSPDGTLLASGAMDGAVHIWQVRTGKLVRTLGQHTGYVLSVSFSPDGTALASGGADGAVRLWEVATGELVRRLDGHAGYVPSVAFSPDGRTLASGGVDGAMRLWDVATGRLERKLQGHTDWVMSVAFSPDGQRFASAGRDRVVRIWEPDRALPLMTLRGHTGAIMSVAFSPRGRYLASGSADHTARVWDLDGDRARRFARVRRAFIGLFATALVSVGLASQHPLELRQRVASFFDEPAPIEVTETPPGTPPATRRAEALPPVPLPTDRSVSPAAQPAAEAPEDPWDHPLFHEEPLAIARGGWTLVVATAHRRADADRLAAPYGADGYRVGIVRLIFEGRLTYHIGVGQFRTHREATAARRRLIDDAVPHTTWVMRLRPEDAF